MKHSLFLRLHKNFGAFALLFVCFTLCLPGASGQTFSGTGTRSVLGSQTTALGLTYYGNAAPNVTPSAANWRTVVRFHVDTSAQVQWAFLGSTWKAQGVIRRVTPPPATATNGSATLDYRYAQWQADGDSTRYTYDFQEGCWSPLGVYRHDTIPTNVASGVGTGAVCYEFSPWLNTDNDSLYLYQDGTWLSVGTGSGGGSGAGVDNFYRDGDTLRLAAGVDTFSVSAVEPDSAVYATLTTLADTAAAIRADFPSVSGVSDGDYTDIDVTSSGTIWTIDTSAVTWPKLSDAVQDSIQAARLDILPDTFGLQSIDEYIPAIGLFANEAVSSYPATSIDRVQWPISTTRFGQAPSTEFGGWLANGTSGDSIAVTAPFGVVIGDSQAEGHPALHGRLHPNGVATYTATYPDSVGQLSYHLRELTGMRWYNHGIGGQSTRDLRLRFFRDAIGITGNTADGRGTSTLPGTPFVCVVIIGINDVYAGVPVSETLENLKFFANTLNQFGIKGVFLNLPGDAIINNTIASQIEQINKALADGILDKYNAVVVDYLSWWRDPTYATLNKPNTALIVDDIHPSKAGYDSLATYIFQKANLPILHSLVVNTRLDPAGFSGYSRPTSITLNGAVYSVSSSQSVDTLLITNILKDTVSIKINGSSNITGTSYSGFSHLLWRVTNNPSGVQYYRKPRGYGALAGSATQQYNLAIRAPNFENQTIFQALFADGLRGFDVVLTNTPTVNIGVGTSLTQNLRVYGTAGFSNNITSLGTRNVLSNFEIRNTGFADGSGSGVIVKQSEGLEFNWGRNDLTFSHWGGYTSTRQFTTANILGAVNWYHGFGGTVATNNITATFFYERPTYNLTLGGGVTGTAARYRYYNPVLTAFPAGIRHIYTQNEVGDNLFNSTSGSTAIGATTATTLSRKFTVLGDVRITDLTTDNPTLLVGADADGDLASVKLSGLSFSNDTLRAVDTNIGNSDLTTDDALRVLTVGTNSSLIIRGQGLNSAIRVSDGTAGEQVSLYSANKVNVQSADTLTVLTDDGEGLVMIPNERTLLTSDLFDQRGPFSLGKRPTASLASYTTTIRNSATASTYLLIQSGRDSTVNGEAGIRLSPTGTWNSVIEFGNPAVGRFDFYSHTRGRVIALINENIVQMGQSTNPADWGNGGKLVVLDTCTLGKGLVFAKKLSANSVPIATFANSTDDRFTFGDNGAQRNHVYGAGDMEAADLSKTRSGYPAHFATDGTLIEDTNPRAEISATTIRHYTLTTAATNYTVDTLSSAFLTEFTYSAGVLTYTGAATRRFLISYALSIATDDSVLLSAGIDKNGAGPLASTRQAASIGTNAGHVATANISGTGIVGLATNDTLKIVIQSDGAGAPVASVRFASLTVTPID